MPSFAKSAQLYDRACQVLAAGVSSGMRRHVTTPPLYFERGEGPYYHDVDGNRLLDYTLAWGPLIVGSNHARLNEAVIAALGESYTLGAQHEREILLAEKLTQVLPGVEQVIFSNTGSEAVQAAIRLARAGTGRNKVVKFEGHYHGWFNNILVSYHPSADQLGTASATCGGQPEAEFADTLVLPWNDLAALERAFAEHDDIACVITEPILANTGSCMPQDGYLRGIIELCQQHGALSIFDEVITGFRVALGGAREYFGLTPDMSTYGKALAGGFTMSAVGGRKEVFDPIRDGRTIHAGTYNGTTFNLAAALATIECLEAPGIYDHMHAHGDAIRNHIEAKASAAGIPVVTSGVGTVFSVHFGVTEKPLNYEASMATDMDRYTTFRKAMLQEGIQLLPDGRWYIGATHGDGELALVTQAIDNAFAAIA